MKNQTAKQAIKTKNQITVKKFLSYLILVVGAVAIFTAPLVHIDFPKKSPNLAAFDAELEDRIIPFQNRLADIRNDYSTGVLSAENYILEQEDLTAQIDAIIEENKVLHSAKVDEFRIFGWKNTRIFLIGFGIRLPYLIFAFIFTFLIKMIKTRDKNLKRTFFFLQLSSFSIAFYELIWVFWHSQDYPLKTYRWAFICISILAALFVTFGMIYYKTGLVKAREKLEGVLDFFVEIRNVHFKGILKPAINADLYNETYQEELKSGTKNFETRLHEEAVELRD